MFPIFRPDWNVLCKFVATEAVSEFRPKILSSRFRKKEKRGRDVVFMIVAVATVGFVTVVCCLRARMRDATTPRSAITIMMRMILISGRLRRAPGAALGRSAMLYGS
jgi:hypothetical protein